MNEFVTTSESKTVTAHEIFNKITIAMNYEYYYDGNHYFIIVNQGEGSMVLWVDGEIREWNGEWGEEYKVSTFQYTVDLQNERWKKDFY